MSKDNYCADCIDCGWSGDFNECIENPTGDFNEFKQISITTYECPKCYGAVDLSDSINN